MKHLVNLPALVKDSIKAKVWIKVQVIINSILQLAISYTELFSSCRKENYKRRVHPGMRHKMLAIDCYMYI